MRRFSLGLAVLTLSLAPACASEVDEEVGVSDDAVAAEWGEIDEDATPLTPTEYAAALEEDDVDDVDDVDEGAEHLGAVEDAAAAPSAAAPPIAPPPPLPPTCAASTRSISSSTPRATPGRCSRRSPRDKTLAPRYTISVPKVAASTRFPDAMLWPRNVRGAGVRAYGSAFRASAEVHLNGSRKDGTIYPGWKNVKVVRLGPGVYRTEAVNKSEALSNDWFLKGVLFRQRMAKNGFRPQAGDTWHINEIGSAWTRTRTLQKAIRDLVRGLATGDQEYDAFKDPDPEIAKLGAPEKEAVNVAARMKDVKGVAFLASLGKRAPGETSNAGIDAALKQTLRHSRFWADMSKYVASFGLERYTPFGGFCKKGQSLPDQADAMAGFIMQLHLVAARAPRYKRGERAGRSTVATALAYLSRAYHPVINAAWGFRHNARSLDEMSSLVAGQIHATRGYARDHATPDNRIGIYFRAKDGASNDVTAKFADRVAASLDGAYDGKAGKPIGACGPSGVVGCMCGK